MKYIYAIAAMVVAACSGLQFQKPDLYNYYKRDLKMTINGITYEGIGVVPKASNYQIRIESIGDISLALFKSCAREDSGTPEKSGPFQFKGKKVIEYTYIPRESLEDGDTCPLKIETYDSNNLQNAWGVLEFTHPIFGLPFSVDCNAREIKSTNGASICQTKQGLITQLKLPQAVMMAPPMPESCAKPEKLGGTNYRILTSRGECLYMFSTQQGILGKLLLIGYEGILVRGSA